MGKNLRWKLLVILGVVALSVFAFNERAIRSYRKAGFVEEGRLRGAIARDGGWWD